MSPAAAPVSEEDIRRHAVARIASIFRMPVEEISLDMGWWKELKNSFVSEWRDNELDELIYDVRDVADRATLKELNSERLVVRTVRDYCDHMVRCYAKRPKMVAAVLKLPGHEQRPILRTLGALFGRH